MSEMMEDWDSEIPNGGSGGISTNVSMNGCSNGFGNTGVGRGKIFGFGSEESSGFGAKNGGFSSGFGDSSTTSSFGFDSARDDEGSGDFGSSSGGFGGSGRRGGDRRGGGRGGRGLFGRGEGRDRGSGCYKCSEDGHMARDCPNPGDSNRGRGGGRGGQGGGCFKCNQEGHRARDCPNSDGSRNSKDNGFGFSSFGSNGFNSKSNQDDEWDNGANRRGGDAGFSAEDGFGVKSSFDEGAFGGFGGSESGNIAPSSGEFGDKSDEPKFGGFRARRGGRGGDRSGGDKRGCFKCGEEGHFSRECPNTDSRGRGGGGKECFKCGEEGHMSRDCPNSNAVSSSGRGGGKGCFKCGEEGHLSRDCPSTAATADPGVKKVPLYIPPPPPEGEDAIFETIAKGINFSRYDEISVECTGNDTPSTGITSFDEVDIEEVFKKNVRKSRYEKPTPIQKWAIPVLLSGRDLMGCAQTGSGKTAAFLLPVLSGMTRHGIEGSTFSEIQEPQAIVVGPTRELVVQIFNEARKFSYGTIIHPVVLYGGVSVSHQLKNVDEGAHIVVGTPGRLLDFIRRKKISLAKVRYFVLDEADRMLDMGFKGDMMELARNCGMPAERQTLMFSATFPEEIQQLARQLLRDYIFITVGRVGGANWDIKQDVYAVSQNDKRDKLLSILNECGNERTLIFVEQKRQADFIASFLSQSNFPTTSIHGDREQREREEALQDFKSARAPFLVATSVAARGLDIANVMHVINYDMPSSIDEYVHRIGRTGRCGNVGKATSFFNPDTDKDLARALVRVLSDAQQPVPSWLEEISEAAYGAGFSSLGGAYGSRDTRKGKFDDDGMVSCDAPLAGRVFGGAPAVADEEDWS